MVVQVRSEFGLRVKEKREFGPTLLEGKEFGFALFYGGKFGPCFIPKCKFGFEFGKRFPKLNSIQTYHILCFQVKYYTIVCSYTYYLN